LGDPFGFQATTQGLARVIVPMNERTQLPTQAAIAAAIATAPVGRFVWLTQQEGSASGYGTGNRAVVRSRCQSVAGALVQEKAFGRMHCLRA